MSKLITTIIPLFFVFLISGQHPTCDGNRYKNLYVGQIDSIIGVQYGQNNTINNVLKTLYLDIFKPHGDLAPKRPLLIYIHSGGFYQGSRNEGKGVCGYFAFKGFVTASIDYRLIDNPQSSIDSMQVATGLIHAMSDAKAAIKFFIHDAATTNTYKIDTNYIFVVGSSAGGITASNLTYLNQTDNIPLYFQSIMNNNGGFAGNTSPYNQHTIKLKGVVNYSGALWRSNWISPNEPPLFSVHETGDVVVKCNYGQSAAFNHPVFFHGSCSMQTEANSQGVFNKSYFINGNGHGGYFVLQNDVDTVLQKTSNFLYSIICQNITDVKTVLNDKTIIKLYPNPSHTKVFVELSESANDTIQLLDLTGRVIHEQICNSAKTEIEVSLFSKGIYILKCKNNPAIKTKLVIE